MDPAAVVTIAGVGVIVAALAAYLITISYILVKVSYTLGTVLIGVRAIADRCAPLQPIIGAISENISRISSEVADMLPPDADVPAGGGPQEALRQRSARRRRRTTTEDSRA